MTAIVNNCYLVILLKAGVSLVQNSHEVKGVIGQSQESFGDTVCVREKNPKTNEESLIKYKQEK